MIVDKPPTMEQVLAHESARLANLPPPVTRHPQLTAHDMASADARFHRQRQANEHKDEYQDGLSEYEALRKQIHSVLGRMHAANVAYSNLTGGSIPTHPHAIFAQVHVPSLLPSKDPWALGISGTTTQAGIDAFQASMGRSW